MHAVRKMFGILIRADFGLWYLLDLRNTSSASWIPVVLIAAILGGSAVLLDLRDENSLGAMISVVFIFLLLAAKMMAVRHDSRQAR